ncbi:MAG: metallophosphoesterase, partial [Chitinophagaceae bacterium]
TDLSWHYQATGQPASYQMKLYSNEYSATEKQVLVNIWNHDPAWKTEYFVDGASKGALEMVEAFDPDAYKTMLGPDLPKPRGFAEPKKNKHVFQAIVPASTKEVRVVATDRFGKQYSETLKTTA